MKMKKENIFYLLVLLTVLIIRISIFLIPEVTIKIFGLTAHHFWFGLALILIGIFIPKKKDILRIIFCSVGIGLFIDQLMFMILGAGMDKEYWALPSLISALFLLLIIFPFRKKMTGFLLKI